MIINDGFKKYLIKVVGIVVKNVQNSIYNIDKINIKFL